MTTRSNTIVRPGGLLRWALCLAALVSLLPLRAADDAPARKVAGELAARFRAMKAYTVTFAVEGDDFAAEGSYAVEGDRYYMRVGDAEAYSDGVSKWEVDPSKREVVVDVVDTQSRSLLGNPTRAFDFLDDAFRSELLPSEGEVRRHLDIMIGKGVVLFPVEPLEHRRRRIAACGDLRSRRRADAYRDPADRTVGRGAALRCGGLRRLRADRFSLRRAGDGSGVSERSGTPLPFGYSPPSTVCSATRRR